MRRRWLLIGLGLFLASALGSGASCSALFGEGGLQSAADITAGLTQPDVSRAFLERVLRLLVESLAIGAAGLLLALVIALPLAYHGAALPRLPASSDTPRQSRRGVRLAIRGILAVLRGIPEIVWAFLFVRIFGLGPTAAVLAIALTFGGIIGKLFAELMESVDPTPVRHAQASGASRLTIVMTTVVPQLWRQALGYALFRLECAVRSASILGVVGAGGIGAELALSVRYFQYDKLATSLLAVVTVILLLELLAAAIKRLRPHVSALVIAAAGLAAIIVLDLPLSELFSSTAATQAGEFLKGFTSPNLAPEFLSASMLAIFETLAMAFFATAVAAALALVLTPWATARLRIGSYLSDPPQARSSLAAALFAASRTTLAILRAVPDLVWALIFVVWVGPGPFAGALAIALHTLGVLGRLFAETCDEVEPGPVAALEASGASPITRWWLGILPTAAPRLLAFALFRFEVNVRATAMVGFVGAGGIGDALHTAISLFHTHDLASLLLLLLVTVWLIDAIGDRLRHRLLTNPNDTGSSVPRA